MKVRVQRTFVDFTDIEVPDEIANNIHALREHFTEHVVIPIVPDELDWIGTDFSNAETNEELGDLD